MQELVVASGRFSVNSSILILSSFAKFLKIWSIILDSVYVYVLGIRSTQVFYILCYYNKICIL